MENFEIHAELMATSREMMLECDELAKHARAYATSNRDFKRERAKAMLNSRRRTVSEREAQADLQTAHLRFNNYLEEGLQQASLERVRSLRAKLSALQTLAGMKREEAAYERTGQNQTA